eukprot:3202749-Lingulodinium_polyedra.AAC.1
MLVFGNSCVRIYDTACPKLHSGANTKSDKRVLRYPTTNAATPGAPGLGVTTQANRVAGVGELRVLGIGAQFGHG